MLAQTELFGHLRQGRRRHQVRFDLRLLPLRVPREGAEQRFGDDEPEHRIAEEFERLVVSDAAAWILVRLGLVGQRVLEQAAILEGVANARFERVELLRQRHDHAAADLFAVTVDDANGIGRVLVAHRNTGLAELVDLELEQPGSRPCSAQRLHAMTVEQRFDDVGLDVGVGPEDDREACVRHAAVAPGFAGSIFIRIIVMSSC